MLDFAPNNKYKNNIILVFEINFNFKYVVNQLFILKNLKGLRRFYAMTGLKVRYATGGTPAS